jgi:primosomal protein N' (replication factor Y) (superfamily II helicase)
MTIAEVLIFRGVPTLYSYTIPEPLNDTIVSGTQVIIPFGRSTVKGLVFNITNKEETNTLKPIQEISPKSFNVPPSLLYLMTWFANYYQCHPYRAYQTIVGAKKYRDLSKLKKVEQALSDPHELTEEQSKVLDILTNSGKREFYLKGVTGSGKTEVYLHLARQIIDSGKSVILLVPEISLTPQLMRHFNERFGNIVAMLHSNQTVKEKEISYNRLLQGDAKIAIGPRSAVFAPVQNLGLIIIDEEHDPSYKQDSHPRYDARTVARERCNHNQATLLFGSATPSLDTYSRFLDSKTDSQVLEMNARFNKQILPKIVVVDMKNEYKEGLPPLISEPLDKAIQLRLEKKEKVMILINRRGYSTQIVCQKCSKPYDCEECGLSFTYHMDKSFRCHRCHVTKPMQFTCKSCGSYKLRFTGTGIQKVEIELRQLFPDSKILRMDKDTVTSMDELDSMFDEFKKDGDILLGTQLISKGHHIEAVTLVGVIGIDTSLNLPDFRAPELSFQLLTQVSGRPGRGKIPGEVVVQTYQPKHYSIEHAKTHNYAEFFKQEMSYREKLNYPPYSALINIILSSTEQGIINKYVTQLRPFLVGIAGKFTVQVIGPQPCPLEKVRNHFRWHVLLKCKHENVQDVKESLLQLPKYTKDLRVITDFDPVHIL